MNMFGAGMGTPSFLGILTGTTVGENMPGSVMFLGKIDV
jgi:hypothetical protein